MQSGVMLPMEVSRRPAPRTRRTGPVRLRDWQDEERWREFDRTCMTKHRITRLLKKEIKSLENVSL